MRFASVVVLAVLLGGCSNEAAYYGMGALLGPVAAPGVRKMYDQMVQAQVTTKGGSPAQAACAVEKLKQSVSEADVAAVMKAKPGGPEFQKIRAAVEAAVDGCMAK